MTTLPEGPIADKNGNPTQSFVHFVNDLAKIDASTTVTASDDTTYPQIAQIETILADIIGGINSKVAITTFLGSKTGSGNITHGLNKDGIDFSLINQSGPINLVKFYEVDSNVIFTDFSTQVYAWKFEE